MVKIKDNEYKPTISDLNNELKGKKDAYLVAKEELLKRESDFFNRYLDEFNLTSEIQYNTQKPSVSRTSPELISVYRRVIKHFLDNNYIVGEETESTEWISLSSVLKELYPEIDTKKIQQRITTQKNTENKPFYLNPIASGVLESTGWGVYKITDRKKAETYLSFLDEII